MYYSGTTSVNKVFLFSLPETHSGNPLTNYYHLSLALLTLCLSDGSYSITNVIPYFTPENKNYYFGGQFSVGESFKPNSLGFEDIGTNRPCPLNFSTSKYLNFFYPLYPGLLRREYLFRRMDIE